MWGPRDERELEELLERYERPLVGYAQRILGDLELARDVVQDTFLKWIENRPPYPLRVDGQEKGGGRLEAWLFTVCRNRAIDVQRRQSRIVPLDFEGGEWVERGQTDPPAPDQALAFREEGEQLSRYVDLLPPNQREVVHLKFRMDRSYKEIAELTGLSVGNVGFLLHRALRRLREWMGDRAGLDAKRREEGRGA